MPRKTLWKPWPLRCRIYTLCEVTFIWSLSWLWRWWHWHQSFVLRLVLPTYSPQASPTGICVLKPSLGFRHQRIFSLCSHTGETTDAVICQWKHHFQLQGWLKACLGSRRAWVNWMRVLQRMFPVSTGCSEHLVRLEGTVHSSFEAWTSVKKWKQSYRGRKG